MTSHFYNGAHNFLFENFVTLARYAGSGLNSKKKLEVLIKQN